MIDTWIKFLIFVVVTAEILHLSWPSLANLRSHGFYRFFAWESVLLMCLRNVPYFFRRPTSVHQILALSCVGISSTLAVYGFGLLHRVGRPAASRSGPALLWMERTTVLVTVGAYRFVRHPLYCSFLFLIWGVFLVLPSWQAAVPASIASISIVAAAKVEEQENLDYFGTVYEQYMKRTKMFVPYIL
ncbi:MAG TPA: isoprenylcysteine carboxylmethyltransferase family protein [Nitrospirota bacterium]|nr:isoprenylcysteine carboxylmethyltransferase family protein [Nitrospirota bacterium]